MFEIILPVVAIGGMGVVFGVLLSIASKIFEVKKDERIPMILEILPGANCGGCGYAGCAAYAEAMVTENAKINLCPSCNNEALNKISEILGVEGETQDRKVAVVLCTGTFDKAKERFEYAGFEDCYTALKLGGGQKACSFGCLGLGSCVKKCFFGAISIIDGVAVVDKEKCVGCGACVKECPKSIIKIFPYDEKPQVLCSSKDKGKETRIACSTGCIGCGICVKNCSSQAITLSDNLAFIDFEKCVDCGVCIEKCPQKVIHRV